MATSDFEVVPSEWWHAVALARDMRPEDAAEVAAARGHAPLEALGECLWYSSMALTLLCRGRVACMAGVIRMPAHPLGAANVWLLTGNEVTAHKKSFLRASRLVVGVFLNEFPMLINYIDARYRAAVSWAIWLGFEVHKAFPYGQGGEPFHEVVMRRR